MQECRTPSFLVHVGNILPPEDVLTTLTGIRLATDTVHGNASVSCASRLSTPRDMLIYHEFTVRRLFIVRHACVLALPRVDCCVGQKKIALATR